MGRDEELRRCVTILDSYFVNGREVPLWLAMLGWADWEIEKSLIGEEFMTFCNCKAMSDEASIHELYCNVSKAKEAQGLQDIKAKENNQKAKRNPVNFRYDILDPVFLEFMAKIAHYGAVTYGDFNWQKNKLEGEKSPINHIYKHLSSYRQGEPYDHTEIGTDRSIHLAAIAFNAMMEFYWATLEEKKNG